MNSRETALNETFVSLADTLVQDFDYSELLQRLTLTCVDVLGAAAAGILLAGPSGTMQVVASSDERTRLLELFELQNDEGPCTDCHASGRRIHAADLRVTHRWPNFTHRALEEGFRSVDALPLRLRDTQIGALNLFNTDVGGLSDANGQVAQALADVATIGLLQERAVRESQLLASQLQHALNSRVTIEQAKGMVAEQAGARVEEAFALMRVFARTTSSTVHAVASRIVAGDLAAADLT